MTLIVPLETSPDLEPRDVQVPADRLLAGSPVCKSWDVDTSKDGLVRTGFFTGTEGTNKSIKGEKFEFCHIVEGVVEITEDRGEPMVFRAGDSFVMKPGFIGQWRTIEPCKKIFVIVE
ncbi:cupin (plasmid) [Alloyangia pacifica]|uniref:Cupin n=1 Tax=Alloyangia pacifica TaxID=311180 RepID=A0A2U8HK39_9RHOB|nr:cupin domain-containing protein [Alloyangia pacifica]AWI86287.1 cupin [Alloyangia pacifica]